MPTTGNFSNFAEELIFDMLFTNATLTNRPTAWYAALMSTVGTDASAATEFDAADYARIAVVMGDGGSWTGVADNDAGLAFGTPATNWGDATQVAIMDALTAGNEITRYTLAVPVACDAGAPVSIPAGSLDQTID